MPLNIYVASSWKNKEHEAVVSFLRSQGHFVYNYREPGFGWSSIDPNWRSWTLPQYIQALDHPSAKKGLKLDMEALKAADVCILLHNSGRSAHLEAGYAASHSNLIIFLEEGQEADLMYGMAQALVLDYSELKSALEECEADIEAVKEQSSNAVPTFSELFSNLNSRLGAGDSKGKED